MQAMSPDQLARWAERAAPGEDAVYCTGPRPSQEIGAAAMALRERGLVTIKHKRVEGGFRFIAERLGGPARVRSAEHRGRFARRESKERRTAETIIYRLLKSAAQAGQPCPTNAELAARAGLSGAVAASYRMRRLVKAGKIVVAEPSPLERRVVTIVATGKSTRRAML